MIEEELSTAIQTAWSASTAGSDRQWSPTNPAAGHCDVTALVIRDLVGGDLRMAQVFRNDELSEHHYWNVLPDGREVDLTKSQFDGNETFGPSTLMDDAFFAAAGPMNAELVRRFGEFRESVERHRATSGSV